MATTREIYDSLKGHVSGLVENGARADHATDALMVAAVTSAVIVYGPLRTAEILHAALRAIDAAIPNDTIAGSA